MTKACRRTEGIWAGTARICLVFEALQQRLGDLFGFFSNAWNCRGVATFQPQRHATRVERENKKSCEMALFSILRGKAPDRDLALRSLLTPVLFAILAGGETSDAQMSLLISYCRTSPLFAEMTVEEIEALVEDIRKELLEADPDVTIPNAISVLPKPLKETSLALAVSVSYVDGVLSDEQDEVLALLTEKMGVSEDTLYVIKTATSLFQRDAVFAT